jgi:hypothetical protein
MGIESQGTDGLVSETRRSEPCRLGEFATERESAAAGASWIKARMADDPARPGGEIGPALKRVLDAGIGEGDLTVIVRTMQWRVLFGLCQLLDDPGSLEKEV